MTAFLLFGCCLGGLLYYFLKPKTCPICNSQNWGLLPREYNNNEIEEKKIMRNRTFYCPLCGEKSKKSFCEFCGHEIKGDD